jgi:hypothetical protein
VNGIAGLHGAPLALALSFNLVVGVTAAAALWLAARAICAHASAALAFIRAALAWLSRAKENSTEQTTLVDKPAAVVHLHPIARKISSRPPPISVRLA